MPTPSQHEVQVALEALRGEATVWLNQSDQMQTVAQKAASQRMSRMEAGVFQLMLSAYDSTADQITARCDEGHQRMVDIADALRQIADVYENEEAKNLHRITNLY